VSSSWSVGISKLHSRTGVRSRAEVAGGLVAKSIKREDRGVSSRTRHVVAVVAVLATVAPILPSWHSRLLRGRPARPVAVVRRDFPRQLFAQPGRTGWPWPAAQLGWPRTPGCSRCVQSEEGHWRAAQRSYLGVVPRRALKVAGVLGEPALQLDGDVGRELTAEQALCVPRPGRAGARPLPGFSGGGDEAPSPPAWLVAPAWGGPDRRSAPRTLPRLRIDRYDPEL
jgi:hypothetical protein